MTRLPEVGEAILRYVQDSSASEEDILDQFVSKQYPKHDVLAYIRDLSEMRNYIRLSDEPYLKPGVYMLNQPTTDEDSEYQYEITALGKSYLARVTSHFTSFSNITNSNIANHSPRTTQSITASDLPQDLQEKIKELDAAVLKREAGAVKKAFNYIADKSVDTAIAIITGTLIR